MTWDEKQSEQWHSRMRRTERREIAEPRPEATENEDFLERSLRKAEEEETWWRQKIRTKITAVDVRRCEK